MRALLEHGAQTRDTAALAHALDYDRPEHVQPLLDAGADPNEGALMAHAVRRGRPPEVLRLLAEHGCDLDAPGGETWRGDVPLRTPFQHAILRGADASADTLATLGARTDVAAADRAVAALARGERPDALPEALDVDQQEVVIMAVLRGHAALVIELLGPDFRGVVGGSPEGTLLHHACWVGDPALVNRLIEAGADPVARSGAPFDTPLAWAALGSQNHRAPGRDYVAVAERLVATGAQLEPRFADVAEGPLAGWVSTWTSRS